MCSTGSQNLISVQASGAPLNKNDARESTQITIPNPDTVGGGGGVETHDTTKPNQVEKQATRPHSSETATRQASTKTKTTSKTGRQTKTDSTKTNQNPEQQIKILPQGLN